MGTIATEIVDDKSQFCIPFILGHLDAHRRRYADLENAPPFLLGLNGVQGAGKTVLVSVIQRSLESLPHNLPTVVFSLDDLYLTHEDQVDLAKRHPDNPLLQHRGQPSTHDIRLAKSMFSSLRQNAPTRIPQYNKAAFDGQGDRVAEDQWQKVNFEGQKIVRVVLFEGWCVGFRPLSDHDLKQKWEHAVMACEAGQYNGRLGLGSLEDVAYINRALREYDHITDQLDAFIHIDAFDTQYVYKWRLEQELNLRSLKGSGMTDDQVHKFVDGYYPAYELFTDNLRAGIFGAEGGRQLRLIVGEDRRVKEVIII